ncbi:unnamed protein product [Nippostrongylus brasiliensis]|uniref:Uncharacterized protein n=1 Tax=Nippostrongylus brasiliensis TaxID=27835 RepID=A0A0N4YFA8_NIPBR|nr:unnamed protein product [Nippostrongylus brasiliensis]
MNEFTDKPSEDGFSREFSALIRLLEGHATAIHGEFSLDRTGKRKICGRMAFRNSAGKLPPALLAFPKGFRKIGKFIEDSVQKIKLTDEESTSGYGRPSSLQNAKKKPRKSSAEDDSSLGKR